MEKQLLPKAELKPAYEQVVWLYVFRDFSNSQSDRAAERIALRFGLTSWPQHLLVDPRTLRVIGDTGRSLNSFRRAVARAAKQVSPTRSPKAADLVKAADARAIALEEKGTVALARESLRDEDIVVRFRALSVLAEKEPNVISENASTLLDVANDPFRYEVCKVLAKTGNREARTALEALVRLPRNSRNPNVLRMNAVKALAACGNADSVKVIAPHAASGQYLNGLTGVSVDALAAIAERETEAASAVRDVLVRALPVPPTKPTATQKRYCERLAKRVHGALEKLTGKEVAFPSVYDRAARQKLRNEFAGT